MLSGCASLQYCNILAGRVASLTEIVSMLSRDSVISNMRELGKTAPKSSYPPIAGEILVLEMTLYRSRHVVTWWGLLKK
jgi:hypothetical protein